MEIPQFAPSFTAVRAATSLIRASVPCTFNLIIFRLYFPFGWGDSQAAAHTYHIRSPSEQETMTLGGPRRRGGRQRGLKPTGNAFTSQMLLPLTQEEFKWAVSWRVHACFLPLLCLLLLTVVQARSCHPVTAASVWSKHLWTGEPVTKHGMLQPECQAGWFCRNRPGGREATEARQEQVGSNVGGHVNQHH